MEIKFRRIKKADIGRLQRFYRANKMANAGSISNNFLLKCIRYQLKDYIIFFIAEYGGEIIGAVYFADQGGLITVCSLAVDERYRNRGIGTKLVKEGLKLLWNKKRNMISVIADPLNKPSLQLFRSLGFTKERKRIRLDKIL
jgi:ribosomal protein S18 acetylase RimI-like enzyme